MKLSADKAPARILLLAVRETTPGTLYGLHEVLSAVGVAWRELTGEDARVRPMAPSVVAKELTPFAAPLGGLPVAPQGTLDDAGPADAVIVTDLALTPGSSPRGSWSTETAWLRRQLDGGALIASVCTGSVLLAEAGLLDGLDAASHWSARRLFAEHYPRVRLRPERILCPAGPEHRIVTSGGAGTWGELALYLIARFSGSEEAVRIAKLFVLGDHSEGQLPFAAAFTALGQPVAQDDAVIGRSQRWLADHYRDANPVARMVALSGLAERTFKRRFKAATGYAPLDYVQALRIEEAKQLLERTGEATDAIAHAVGYEDPAFFRRLFKRLTGTTPARYRQRYRFVGVPCTDDAAGNGSLEEARRSMQLTQSSPRRPPPPPRRS